MLQYVLCSWNINSKYKKQLKRKTQRVCYLPNETIMERNRETFEEDAKYANTLGITVFN